MHIDKRLIKQITPIKYAVVFTILFGLLAATATIVQAFLISDIINNVFLKGLTLSDVQILLYIILGISICKAFFIWVEQNFANRIAKYIKDKLRKKISDHIFKLGPNYTKSEKSGEIANTLVNGVEKLDAYFSKFLPQLFLSALIPFLILFFVFPIDLLSGFVLLVTAPLIPVFMILIGSAAESINRKQWKILNIMSAYFLDVIQGLTTVKLFGRSNHILNKISTISLMFKNSTMKVLRIAFLSALVLEIFSTISIAIIAVEIGLRLMYGNMEFQPALFILIIAPEFYNPIRQLGIRYHAGMEGVAAAQSIFQILETPLPINTKKSDDSKLTVNKIEYKNVHFSYETDERIALNGVSFTIKRNEITALVGESGSGKTTTSNLLLKFIEPTNGEIRINDRNLSELDRNEWLKQIGWISQNPYLFHTTIKENLLIAKEDATEVEILNAIKLAQLESFINSIPNGFDTIVGERGVRLSGGEAQRLALARAFLKDAPILILDEPTANLDPNTEAEMIESIKQLTKEKTVLMIAHRLNTIEMADNILVFSEGKIVEQGKHNELNSSSGIYSELLNKYRSKN